MSKLFRTITLIIIISTLLAACSSDEPTAPPTDIPPTATDVPPTDVPPTDVPPTATDIPPTDIPPTATDAPPTDTPTPEPMPETVAPDDGSRIVFISDRDGPREVYVMDASGANQRQVAGPEQGGDMLMWPSWSPDGQRIAYQAMLFPEDDSLGEHGGYLMQIWVVGADGSQPTNVSESISDMLLYTPRPPAWSLDGQRLAFLADSDTGEGELHSTLYVVWADGSGLERSVPLPWEAYSLTWSPTEDKLLLRSLSEDEGGVYVLSLQDNELVRVYGESWALGWSPDGQEIIVGSDATQEILILGADGEARPLAQFEGRYAIYVAWSPDGEHIAVATTNSSQVYKPTAMHIVAVETGEITLVVDTDDANKSIFALNWSPDSSRLLYTIGDRGRPGTWPYAPMWIYDLASGQTTQLTPDEGIDGFGSWSPASQAGVATDEPTIPVFSKSNQRLGNTRSFGLAITDVDLDHDEDVFIANYIGSSRLWINNGKGTFTESSQTFGVPEVHDVGIADFNGDGYPDIFLLSHAAPSKVYFNDGSGIFTDSGQNIGIGTEYPGMIVLGDVDNDDDVDAFISHYEIPNRLWLNDGNGLFAKLDVELGEDGNPGHMELADFNGDSFPDLFLCMTDAPDRVLLNDGRGNFTNTGQALGSSVGNDNPQSKDIDGDGDNDVIVANNREGIVIWLNQNNTGTYVAAGDYFGDDISLTFELFDADLDGDFDLITSQYDGGNVLWMNDGKGHFTSLAAVFGSAKVFSIGSKDIDGDGDIDLVFGQEEGTGGNEIYFNEYTPAPSPTPMPLEASNTNNTWTKTFGGNKDVHGGEVLLADDGGYFILGTTNMEFEPEMKGDIYLIRTDAAGEVLWEKTYGGPGYEHGGTIYPADDGGLMLAGVTTSFGAVGMDAYLVKVDQEGNELWSKTFGGPLDEWATAWQLPDGGYMVGGNVVDPNDPVVEDAGAAGYGGFVGRSNIYLSRTDSEGNELWTRTFGGENNVMATSALPTDDGGFVILASIMYYPQGGDDIYLLKVDENGNEVWSYTWEQDSTSAQEVVEAADGGYLISASYSTSDDPQSPEEDYLFIKVDSEGNELWSSIFGDPDMIDYGHVLAATDDGGFVAAGEKERDRYNWDADIALVKIDENGQLLWEKVFDTSTHSMFSTLFQHPDGGYVIAGASYIGPGFNIFLTKTDADGNVLE